MDLHLEEKYLKYIHRVKKKWFPNPGKLMELFGNFRFLTGFQLEPWCFQQISLLWKWLRSDCQVSMSAETVLILLFPHMVISWISHLETRRNQSIIVYVLLPKRKLQGLFYGSRTFSFELIKWKFRDKKTTGQTFSKLSDAMWIPFVMLFFFSLMF